MSLQIKYFDVPPGAQEAMAVDTENENCIAAPQQLAEGAQEHVWATLEAHGWRLDGSCALMPEDPSVGFWSREVSDERAGILGCNRLGRLQLNKENATAAFETPPLLTLQFPRSITATGLTFTFAPREQRWCSRMAVSWYSGQTLLVQKTVYPDAAIWTLAQLVEGFDRIRIELLQTDQPGQFAKIQKIEIGQTVLFGRQELTAVHLVNETDPSLSKLTVDTMRVSIQDKHSRVLYPQENQKVELYRNGALIATHYITDSTRQSRGGYSFSCQSAIGLLEDTFLGGLYSAAPIQSIVEEVLGGRAYDLGAFSDRQITGYLPVCTRREALQQISFAIGAMIITQGTGKICFCPIPQTSSGVFTKSRIFSGGSVKTAPHLYKVEVDAHSYIPANTAETLLENEQLHGDALLLTFDAPHHSYAITGGTLLSSGANWVSVCADGQVTLTGKPYLHTIVRHSRQNALATAAQRNNTELIQTATLVHSGNVGEVLERLYQLAKLRQTMCQEAVIEDQHAGQMVSMEDAWGEMVQGYISVMESELTQGGHTAQVTVVGRRKQPETAYGFSGEIYAGDTEVVYG